MQEVKRLVYNHQLQIQNDLGQVEELAASDEESLKGEDFLVEIPIDLVIEEEKKEESPREVIHEDTIRIYGEH